MSFEEHCKTLKIELLPEDIAFIRNRMKKVPRVSYKTVLNRYAEIWSFERNTCVDLTKSQNMGRRAANKFLMEYTQ